MHEPLPRRVVLPSLSVMILSPLFSISDFEGGARSPRQGKLSRHHPDPGRHGGQSAGRGPEHRKIRHGRSPAGTVDIFLDANSLTLLIAHHILHGRR